VLLGETATEVPVTVPTPGLIDTEVAPVTLHDSVELCPDWIDGGLAVNAWIDGIDGPGLVAEPQAAIRATRPTTAIRSMGRQGDVMVGSRVARSINGLPCRAIPSGSAKVTATGFGASRSRAPGRDGRGRLAQVHPRSELASSARVNRPWYAPGRQGVGVG